MITHTSQIASLLWALTDLFWIILTVIILIFSLFFTERCLKSESKCDGRWPVTNTRQCLVSPEPEGGADTEQGEGTEHLSWSGQRAGKPVMVTSVTSHSRSDQCPGTGPWWNGHWAGHSGEQPLSRKLESREETAPALITSPQH